MDIITLNKISSLGDQAANFAIDLIAETIATRSDSLEELTEYAQTYAANKLKNI
jgi:hypothetical protein